MAASTSKTPDSALAEEESVARATHPPPSPPLSPRPAHSPAYITAATFASAGLGNMTSAICTNGFDVVKIRQQLQFERQRISFVQVGRDMLVRDGVLSWWTGVTASCLREGTYSTIRMGGYEPCKRLCERYVGVPEGTFGNKLLAGIASGATGAAITTPTDLLKVRMQAVRPEPDRRPPYKTTFHGFAQIFRQGGVKALWTGVGPNTMRAAILTSSQVGTYDEVKGWFRRNMAWQEGMKLHLAASMVAGFVCSAASSPVDVIKVRVMHQASHAAATGGTQTALALFTSLLREEGPLALWKGFGMCWARLGTHTVISLVLFETFRGALGVKPL